MNLYNFLEKGIKNSFQRTTIKKFAESFRQNCVKIIKNAYMIESRGKLFSIKFVLSTFFHIIHKGLATISSKILLYQYIDRNIILNIILLLLATAIFYQIILTLTVKCLV